MSYPIALSAARPAESEVLYRQLLQKLILTLPTAMLRSIKPSTDFVVELHEHFDIGSNLGARLWAFASWEKVVAA